MMPAATGVLPQRTRRAIWRMLGGMGGALVASVAAAWTIGTMRALPAQPGPSTAADAHATAMFTRFALNALLVPLLDDSEPAQWTDVALAHFCGPATRVTVDGRPLMPGAEVPARSFMLRWQIDQCWPMDYASFELSGTVDLHVFHEDGSLSAVVDATRLRVAGPRGSGRPAAPFAAWMALDPNEPPGTDGTR